MVPSAGFKKLEGPQQCADLFFLIFASATMCCWSQALSKIWHSCHSSVTKLTQLLNSVINRIKSLLLGLFNC